MLSPPFTRVRNVSFPFHTVSRGLTDTGENEKTNKAKVGETPGLQNRDTVPIGGGSAPPVRGLAVSAT